MRFDWPTLAFASPMRSGKLYVEHPSGAIPSLLNGVWNVAVSDAMIVSVSDAVGWWCVSVCYSSTGRDWMHFKKSNCVSAPDVTAMPIAGPLTAAMIGFGKSMYDWNVLHSVTVCRCHVQAIYCYHAAV